MFANEQFTLWRCRGCGSLHCAEDADLARYYDPYPLKQQQVTFSERVGYSNRLRLLERAGFERGQEILDYGCGAGLFIKFLREKGVSHIVGYDAFVPEYSDSSVLGHSYDAVVSYDVIEHADDCRAFMACLAGLVRPGGLLAVGTPNADNLPISRAGDPNHHVPYHRHILSERALLALGREHDVEPIHVYRRSFYDSLVPTVNSRFMWRYIQKTGGFLDAAVEPPRTDVVLRSPEMVFLAFFGYFVPRHDNILVTFRKASRS